MKYATRNPSMKATAIWRAAIRKFRADYPGAEREVAREFAERRFFGAVEGVDESDERFAVEAPDVARLFILEEHAAHNCYAKVEA